MALFIELLLMGVGLAMDAFAVSVCKGLGMKKLNKKQAVVIGLYFGGFQALMPLVGWILGIQFQKYITSIDHWIAFILLGIIGGGMLKEAFEDGECKECGEATEEEESLDIRTMLGLAVATSIDALAVGITLAFLNVDLIASVSFIGIITFLLSGAGVRIGNVFGTRYKSKAELAGGIILIGMGLKILLEHLGILG